MKNNEYLYFEYSTSQMLQGYTFFLPKAQRYGNSGK